MEHKQIITSLATQFDINGMMRLVPLTNVPLCNAANEGAIYYDKTAKKHFGCNGTKWNSLYLSSVASTSDSSNASTSNSNVTITT